MSEFTTGESGKAISVYLADETTDSTAIVRTGSGLGKVDLADEPVIGMRNHIYFIPDDVGQEFVENDD